MQGHYNLYYLFLEDRQAHPMKEEDALRIRKYLERFFKNPHPPDSETQENSSSIEAKR